MIGLLLVYGALGWGEWQYMTRRKRKKRTHLLVYSVMGLSFIYNLLILTKPEWAPNPNIWLTRLFQPLQDLLTAKKN